MYSVRGLQFSFVLSYFLNCSRAADIVHFLLSHNALSMARFCQVFGRVFHGNERLVLDIARSFTASKKLASCSERCHNRHELADLG